MLTPIAMAHTIVFLASVADVWNTRKRTDKDFETKSNFFLAVSDDQLRVISLVLDIKVIDINMHLTLLIEGSSLIDPVLLQEET